MVKDDDNRGGYSSRRSFLSAALAYPLAISDIPVRLKGLIEAGAPAINTRGGVSRVVKISSPNSALDIEIAFDSRMKLNYSINLKRKPVLEASPMGIVVDGVDLGRQVKFGSVDRYRVSEKYPYRGAHSEAINNCNGAKIAVLHVESNTLYSIEVRAYDNGIAFRYVVSGDGKERAPDEGTGFVIPDGSTVWYHDFEGHYEGIHSKKDISEVRSGEWAAPPLTFKLPNGAGYAAITEAALINYSGMGLQSHGRRSFAARLGHALPVSYPFRLRYGDEEGKRLAKPAAIVGTITTPWRVVMASADLNGLVNCDVIQNVSPPPDNKLFPQGVKTAWIKPGRAVWKYLDGGENTLEEMKNFSNLAGKLGFEYNVVEGFWRRWTEDQMRELVEYSRQQKVGVWFWKHSRELRTPEARRQFFKLCNDVGVVGAKIDFFDHEAKEIIDLYQAMLKDAAKHRIMLNFHGANKPAGESRTWPNEMMREGIRGLEYRSMQTRAVHNTTLPFTRMLAGHADYTPVHFGERRRETSWAHQIASGAIFTSPVLIYGAHPKNILENPAVDMIKSIPSVWDETIALPVSEVGEVAAFARRSGDTWFLAIMNGPTARELKIPLSFLGKGKYEAMLVRDRMEEAGAVNIEHRAFRRPDILTVELRSGGGFIARFSIRKGL